MQKDPSYQNGFTIGQETDHSNDFPLKGEFEQWVTRNNYIGHPDQSYSSDTPVGPFNNKPTNTPLGSSPILWSLSQAAASHSPITTAEIIPSDYSSSEDVSPPPTPKNSGEPKEEYTCRWDTCNASFKTNTGLSTHLGLHLNNNNNNNNPPDRENADNMASQYRCRWNDCTEIFGSKKKLLAHLSRESHVGRQPYQPRNTVRRGSRIPADYQGRIFTCSGCDMEFTDSSNCKKHEQTHIPNRRRFYCHHAGCSKSYSTKTDLAIHFKVHLGQLDHKCTYAGCNKAFVRRSELYAHERAHDKILTHRCDVCSSQFREKSRWKKHMLTHEASVPHPNRPASHAPSSHPK